MLLPVRCHQHGAAWPWQVVTPIGASKRRSLLMAGDDDEVFMTRSLNVTPKTTKQQLIVRIGKSIAYVTITINARRFVLLKLITDRHEASRGLLATAELLVVFCYRWWWIKMFKSVSLFVQWIICDNNVLYCFLAECYYVMFALWHKPSVCSLSVCRLSVTLLHPTQRLELYGNIFCTI